MLPPSVAELCLRIEAEATRPRYFTERDLPWVAALLEAYRAFEGERRLLLRERLREPLQARAPFAKLRVLNHLLEELAQDRVRAALAPARARWLVFSAAAAAPASRAEVLSRVAASEGIDSSAIEAALFADLESERRVAPLPSGMVAQDCLGLGNRALVAALLMRAVEIRIRVGEEAMPRIARAAWRNGLICAKQPLGAETASSAPTAHEPSCLYVSGPLALFRHSQVYARSLAALFPALVGCSSFELEAECRFARAAGAPPLRVSSSDPVALAGPEQAVTEPLLARFVTEFREFSSGWAIEEASATCAGEGAVVPDFEMFHEAQPERRWFLFIVRRWTQRSLATALAGARDGLVCADAAGACDAAELPVASAALFFRKRPDARKVLAWLAEQQARS